MYRVIRFLMIVVALCASTSFTIAAQDFSAWNFSQTIFLNTTTDGADINDSLFNFPVLIRLTPENFSHFSHTQDSGKDIRFSKMDGTPLPYQIELWLDGTDDDDTAAIWVLADTLPANQLTPAFIMYWGNSETSDSSDGAAVFATDNGFSGVWHLNESSGSLSDATGNGYNGNRNGNVSQSPGAIGYGQELDGSDDYAEMGNVLDAENSNFTVSAWLKRDSLNAWQAIVGKTNGGNPSSAYGWLLNINADNKLSFYLASGNGSNWGDPGSYRFSQADSIVDTTTWHHVAVVIDRSGNAASKLYIDGTDDSGTINGDITTVGTVSNAVNARIGSEADGQFQFNGLLDEMVFSTTARSDAWIKLCYENQKPEQTLVQMPGSFTWQSDADGNWGNDAQWSPDGTQLSTWPGRGNNALLTTEPAGDEIILTVTDTQYVDSIYFGTQGYRIVGDVLYLGGINGGTTTASTVDSAFISAEITGSNGLSKSGTGTLVLSGNNTYSGTTSVNAGALAVNGTLSDESDVTVASGATLSGSGTIGGTVTVSGGTVAPGYNGTGKLNLGSLTLNDASTLTFNIGTTSDTLAVSGNVTLEGTITFALDNDVTSGDYLIMTTEGTITDNSPVVTQPGNDFYCTLIVTDSTVIAQVSSDLILTVPADTIIQLGTTAHFSVTAQGEGTLSYLWQREPEEEVSTTDSLSLDPAALADSGNYRCIVTDDNKSDTSEWFHITVLDSPRIETQPVATEINSGGSGSLWLTVSNTDQLTFAWYRVGNATALGTGAALTFDNVSLDDAGDYYCILSNPIAEISSDTVTVTIIPEAIQAYFKFTPDAGLAPLNVAFTDSSIGTVTSRHWNFGDAATDTAASPQHTFFNAGTYTVALAISGPDGDDTLVRDDAITVYGKDDNPLTITASPFGEDSAIITISGLDNAPVSHCDSVFVWIAADTIPLSNENVLRSISYSVSDFTAATFTDTLRLPSGDTAIGLLTGLLWNSDTIAPFDPTHGTVVHRNTTTTPTDTAFGSIIELTDLSWDSTTGQIRVSWCLDTARYKGDMDIGIAYSRTYWPDSSAINWKTVFFAPCMDTTVALKEPVQFESLYYVKLFVRKTNEQWMSSAQVSNDTIRTGRPYRQITRFFDETTGDTVGIFNRRVILWKDPSISGKTLTFDTVQLHTYAPPEGFIVTGTPVRFVAANSRPSFYIGFNIDSLPQGYSLKDVRIYHEDNGRITVEHETRIDTTAKMIFLQTTPSKAPFIPMIDMTPPVAVPYPVSDPIADPDNDITDTVRVRDNIFNVKWQFLYGKGDEAPLQRNNGILNDTVNVLPLAISQTSQTISSESGIRILLVITDGPHSDTIDMSRSVFRDESDPLFTLEERWHPVYPTAHLLSSDPETLLVDKIDSSVVRYDRRLVRLFRWVETDSTKNMNSKWLEYDPENVAVRALFSITPGRLLWIKTRKSTLLHLGDAYTLSLKDTFSLTLPSKQFTDFGLPYRFPIRLQTIFDASGPVADSMHYHVWVRDSATGIYKADLLYLTTMPDKKDASVALTPENSLAYTIYNPLNRDVTLRIPPLPVVMTPPAQTGSMAKKASPDNWSVKLQVKGSDGFTTPALYCGYSPTALSTDFPIPPSFNGSSVYAYDRALARKQGHYFSTDANNGVLKEVHFTNTSSYPKTVSYSFSTVGNFPETFSVQLLDKNSGTFSTEGTVTLPAESVASRWISVGDAAWHDKLSNTLLTQRFRLYRLYPNPARSQVTIRYSVPFGAEEKLTFSVFDMKGRLIWDKRITAMLTSDIHYTTWNGRDNQNRLIGAGMYIVRLAVTNGNGATLHRFDQCITFFP